MTEEAEDLRRLDFQRVEETPLTLVMWEKTAADVQTITLGKFEDEFETFLGILKFSDLLPMFLSLKPDIMGSISGQVDESAFLRKESKAIS